jgi:hypothetical protein
MMRDRRRHPPPAKRCDSRICVMPTQISERPHRLGDKSAYPSDDCAACRSELTSLRRVPSRDEVSLSSSSSRHVLERTDPSRPEPKPPKN